MDKITPIKLSELSKIVDRSLPSVSRHFKGFAEDKVSRSKNRIIGVYPEGVEEFLRYCGISNFYQPSITLSANLCGGVGKTTSIYNLGICMRRMVSRETPIVFVDSDSQGSFTSIVFGQPATDDEPILMDFLEKKNSIDDILVKMEDNIWFVKSNLRQAFIDKIFVNPRHTKEKMLVFYQSVFEKLGNNTMIFQDHTPQLSNLFASSLCALHQIPKNIIKNVLIPIRSDNFSVQGADYILEEMESIKSTFGFPDNINIHCFYSSIDKRISTTKETVKLAQSKQTLVKHLAPTAIRYCSEIPKSIMRFSNVYSSGKHNNAAEDYQELLQYIFSANCGG